MPVICPPCQLAFDASMPAAGTFAWGCFRYFGSTHLQGDFSVALALRMQAVADGSDGESSTMPFAQRLTCTIDDACEVTGLGRT